MADRALRPLSALGRPFLVADAVGPVAIRESTDWALASVAPRRGREADLRARAEAAGLPLPPPGRAAWAEPWGAFWTGPDMWFAEAPAATHDDMVGALAPLLGDAASLTEQTDAWVRLELEGPLAPLLERLCNLDLARFPPGSATRTAMEHVGVQAIRRAEDRLTLLGPRSMAGSLHHAILAAARSVL